MQASVFSKTNQAGSMRCTITCKQETEAHHCETEISMTLIGWLILKSIKTTSADSCFHVSLRKLSAYSKKLSITATSNAFVNISQ